MVNAEPEWASDLVVLRGGAAAEEVLLLSMAAPNAIRTLARLGAAWTKNQADTKRTWVVYAMGADALTGIRDYFGHAPGEDVQRDRLAAWLEARIPLSHMELTEVSIMDDGQVELIQIGADPPLQGGKFVTDCVYGIRALGFTCVECTTGDILYQEVHYATGDYGLEQVVEWHDLYSDAHWRFLSSQARLQVTLHPDVATMSGLELERLARVIPQRRLEALLERESQAGAREREAACQKMHEFPACGGERSEELTELDAVRPSAPSDAVRLPTRDPWLAAGLDAESAASWRDTVSRIFPSHVRNIDYGPRSDQPAQVDTAWSEDDYAVVAAQWSGAGFTPGEAEAWTSSLDMYDDRRGASIAGEWRSRGFSAEEAWYWVKGDAPPNDDAEHSQIFRDADWHFFHVWTLYCLLEPGGDAWEDRRQWARLPITHALNCARAGLTPSEAEALLGQEERELDAYLAQQFTTRRRIDPFTAMHFNHQQWQAFQSDDNESDWPFYARHLWDLHDEDDDRNRRLGRVPTYGGPRVEKPSWRIREEREERAVAEAARPKPVECSNTGGEGRLEFRDGMEDWYVHCPECGAMWMGGNGDVLPAHDRRR